MRRLSRRRYPLLGAGALLLLGLPFAAAAEEPAPSHVWLRHYPLPEVGAHWHIDLDVPDFEKARAEILEMMGKYKARSRMRQTEKDSSPGFKYQQFSFDISRADAQKSFERLKQLGLIRQALQKDSDLPDHSQEISIKLGRLRAERRAGGDILRRLSAVAALTDELIAHLEKAEATQSSARQMVLLDIVIEETPK